jgi:hypothetical protein
VRIEIGEIPSGEPDQASFSRVTDDLSFRERDLCPVGLDTGVERCNVQHIHHAREIDPERRRALVVVVGLIEPINLSAVAWPKMTGALYLKCSDHLHRFIT